MTDDLTGKCADRLVIDDPHADLIALTPVTRTLAPRSLGQTGEVQVTGQITAYFVNDALLRTFRTAQAAHRNRVLRMIRPHMGRRAFRRLRGRAKEARRC